MSDVEGSDGENENIAAELNSKCWEARLELARKQRAAALANNQAPREPKTPADTCPAPPRDEAPAKPGASKFEQVIFKSTQLKKPVAHSRRKYVNRMYPIIFGAMLCGAFLHWAATSVLAGWRNPDTVVQAGLPIESASETDEKADPREDSASLSNGELDTPKTAAQFDNLNFSDITSQPGLGSLESEITKPVGNMAPPVLVAPEVLLLPALQNLNKRDKSLKSARNVTTVPAVARGTVPETPEMTDYWPVQDRTKETEVSLFVPAGVSKQTSITVLEILTSDQTDVVATARVSYSVKATQVRYYHHKDSEVADLTAKSLGGISRDFTNAGSKTRPGHIEVYLAGTGGSRTRPPNPGADPVERFVLRILEEFQ
ncbi:hypothetical protein RUE5091_03720 [Ruegeria denitrificans]|uniref:Uncharacterized protein n=1 Tax=Ruegeria denitrificans TaxID=1715692 RepID=A0A0P1IHT0_9RHOB|nr:hypothetical protein [Ruegeria denitrificans]CUK14007.1 hypothetical protein RUE5091_03720 [Ruegeria denitrificans]